MQKKQFNLNLEGLRGFAALGVMVGHIFYHDKYFDKRFCPIILKNLIPNAHSRKEASTTPKAMATAKKASYPKCGILILAAGAGLPSP